MWRLVLLSFFINRISLNLKHIQFISYEFLLVISGKMALTVVRWVKMAKASTKVVKMARALDVPVPAGIPDPAFLPAQTDTIALLMDWLYFTQHANHPSLASWWIDVPHDLRTYAINRLTPLLISQLSPREENASHHVGGHCGYVCCDC